MGEVWEGMGRTQIVIHLVLVLAEHVDPQVGLGVGGELTQLARERFLPSVYSHVAIQFPAGREHLDTNGAWETGHSVRPA